MRPVGKPLPTLSRKKAGMCSQFYPSRHDQNRGIDNGVNELLTATTPCCWQESGLYKVRRHAVGRTSCLVRTRHCKIWFRRHRGGWNFLCPERQATVQEISRTDPKCRYRRKRRGLLGQSQVCRRQAREAGAIDAEGEHDRRDLQ